MSNAYFRNSCLLLCTYPLASRAYYRTVRGGIVTQQQLQCTDARPQALPNIVRIRVKAEEADFNQARQNNHHVNFICAVVLMEWRFSPFG